MQLTDKEIAKIYRNVATGPNSMLAAHDDLDEIMREFLGEEDFTGTKGTISNQKLQIIINLINTLKSRLDVLYSKRSK